MSKSMLILSGTPRKNGNSEILCESFAQGAREAGHHVENISLREVSISPCLGCEHCLDNGGRCV